MGNGTLKTDKCQLSTVNSQLMEGYKQSEVGVIPEDWEVKTLGDIFTFGGGYSASWDQLSSEGYCYLHYGDIHKSVKSFIDVRAEYPNIPKFNILLKRISPKSLLHDGDIVFVDASEDDEGTSKHIVVVNNENITYISGLHTIVAKSKVAVLDNEYKRYCFQSRDIKKQFYFYAVGTKVSGISKTNIAKLKLPIPPLPEQQAIASALSDVDALITALEQLITKKRNIKQGAMQQLLTGKKRLPGFGGVWEVKNFSDVCWFQEGPGLRNWQFTNEGMKVINVTNLENGYLNLDRTDRHISIDEFNKMYQHFEIDDRDIVVASSGNSYAKTAVVRKRDLPLMMNTSVIRFKPLKTLEYNFLLSFLKSDLFKDQIDLLITGGAQPNFGPAHLKEIKITIPEYFEQQTIAKILSDMDAELEALEQKQAKYKAIKQGMMQELLTGKMRLVKEDKV